MSDRHRPRALGPALVALAGFTLLGAAVASAQTLPDDHLDALRYRYIGPQGNRISSVAGVAGDPSTYYVGAAAGGVWKSEDGGVSWRPLFDGQDVEAVGALAVSRSDPQIVWAGTGEPHLRSNVSVGDGVYKSTDGGEHWTHMGLAATGRISRIVIHPRNPDIVYVAALGHTHAPQQERGIYRTMDGGRNWERVLFADENTGASDITMDPNNPRVLFAGMWTVEMHHWGRESGGPGSGIYTSRDGGDTWRKLTGHGLPNPPIGKTTLCMTPADSRFVYAMIETGDGVPLHGQPTDTGSCGAPRTAARPGSCATTAVTWAAAPPTTTSAAWPRTTRTRCTSWPRRIHAHWTAARPTRSSRDPGGRAATTTTCGSIRWTPTARSSCTTRACPSRRTAERRGTGSSSPSGRCTT